MCGTTHIVAVRRQMIKHQGTAVFELCDVGLLNLPRLQVTGIHLFD